MTVEPNHTPIILYDTNNLLKYTEETPQLESEGFEFTNGIDGYSTINGAKKDNIEIEYPLVVKSYKYKDTPLKIRANEWIQLVKPNSLFWVHFSNL